MITRAKFRPECIREVGPPTHEKGFLIHGIADGEAIVRQWNPDFAHYSLNWLPFKCIHKVTPVDPENSKPAGPIIWVRSIPKIDFARYAVDYAENSCAEPASAAK
jgi:hypothetical protein